MRFSFSALSSLVFAAGASGFCTKHSLAFVPNHLQVSRSKAALQSGTTYGRCNCPKCAGSAAAHRKGCSCGSCKSLGMLPSPATQMETAKCAAGCPCPDCKPLMARKITALYSSAVEGEATEVAEEVPAEVEALDGIESAEEAHNAERPARKSLKKKGPRGKALSEFSVGESVKAKVKTLTSYGAFVDIGATTDGLLHISQLSVEFVSDVNEVLTAGQEIDVRITNIDEGKNQVALTMLTPEQEEAAKQATDRPQRQQRERGNTRRDDSAVLGQLVDKGWNSEQFVEGTVVTTVDFGAFVRVEASQLQEGVEGTMDGLVHISALAARRVDSVTSVVNVGDKVQVRVKAIADQKVSLSMVSPEDEAAKVVAGQGSGAGEGAKDWKESVERIKGEMPEFKNRPLVVDLRT